VTLGAVLQREECVLHVKRGVGTRIRRLQRYNGISIVRANRPHSADFQGLIAGLEDRQGQVGLDSDLFFKGPFKLA